MAKRVFESKEEEAIWSRLYAAAIGYVYTIPEDGIEDHPGAMDMADHAFVSAGYHFEIDDA